MTERVILDVAGGGIGGAARWVAELDGFLAATGAAVTVTGQGRRLTPGWLAGRECRAIGARMAVAANNVSFLAAGGQRRVVLRNALHFPDPGEEPLLARMPRSFRAQLPVVRSALGRADTVVVPSAGMAERVRRCVPAVRNRLVVRPHPVTPVGPRQPAAEPFLLVPVLPAPYKNLVPQLATLLAALDRAGLPIEVRLTAGPADLPAGLARHPRLRLLGTLPHHRLARLWQQATGAFFPSTMEAFGYPLAEARVYGVPVLAPDGPQAREIAGPALAPYRSGDLASLTGALDRLAGPVPAEPSAYDRDGYFRWLCGLPAAHPATTAGRSSGIPA
jgi:glycosyltransferase involved in cell wall biosynthesis